MVLQFPGLVLACAVILCLSVSSELMPPERSYTILMLTPVSTKSHLYIFMPIAEELAKRGHKITILSAHYSSPASPNITVLTHSLRHLRVEHINLFEVGHNLSKVTSFVLSAFWKFARDFYQDATVEILYRNRSIYDAVIIDTIFNEVAFPFAYKMPFITLSGTGTNEPTLSSLYGNTLHPAYVSNSKEYLQTPMSFLQRMANYIGTVSVAVIQHLVFIAPVQYQISRQFPELPSLSDLARNQSLALINSHFSMSTVHPLLPGQVEIGGIQCRPARTLPTDVLSFIDGDIPVVYFALGTAITLPHQHRDTIISAFSKLPYKFLWVYHEELSNTPPNILTRKTVPQQDVLGHPNVKLFITHGGVLGAHEAIYHSTPLLAIPVTFDHPKTAMRIQSLGVGLTLYWDRLTKQLLMDTIVEIISNQRYQSRISELSVLLRDQLNTPMERAVYWIEYVIRHRGAPHLSPPERDLTWIQFFHLDVLAAFLLAGYLLYKITRLMWRMVRRLFSLSLFSNRELKMKKIKKTI